MGNPKFEKEYGSRGQFCDRSLLYSTVGAALLLIIFICVYPFYWPHHTPVIALPSGRIQGKVAHSRDGVEYWQFLSIPFAQPPVRSLKFQPPRPAQPWVGVKQVVDSAPLCVQFDSLMTQHTFGQEDCLYLNVYAPPYHSDDKSQRKLPVLVHIHGGGFILGGSFLYGPDYLMDHPIVIVTFNYRLGPFGFLNFEHDPATDGVHLPRGNVGMKDQLMALRWVKQNIALFGGDPDRVTLCGESAGGLSVHLHVLSEKSRGLFHRAISHSGSAFCDWGWTSQPRKVAMDFAARIGCQTNDTQALLICLENYDPWEMVKFQLSSTDPAVIKDNLSPSIESVESADRFLDKHPQDIMDSGRFSKVPYILGVNSGDGGLRTGRFDAIPERVDMLRNNWTETIGNVLLIDELAPSKAKAIRQFYMQGNGDALFKSELTKLFTDKFAGEPVERAARGYANGGGDAWLFLFNYTARWFPGVQPFFAAYHPDSWLNSWIQLGWQLTKDWMAEHVWGGRGTRPYGVGHTEEILQLWNVLGISKYMSGADYEFSKELVRVIADFTQEKDPPRFKDTVWPKLENGSLPTYMLLDNTPVGNLLHDPYGKSFRFWNSLGVKQFNRHSAKRVREFGFRR